jgi:hypothetical protein
MQMSRFIPIDLTEYCNHRLIYNRLPEENAEKEFGLDNICILKSDAKLKKEDVYEGVNFEFCFGRSDNIVCDRQRITVNEKASKLHIICFGYWGDTNEYFKVIYDDLSEENVKVPFIDWSRSMTGDFMIDDWYGSNVATVKTVITSGALIHLAHFHHAVCELTKQKRIKEIVLPDNMFAHIFAITLENEMYDTKNQKQEY